VKCIDYATGLADDPPVAVELEKHYDPATLTPVHPRHESATLVHDRLARYCTGCLGRETCPSGRLTARGLDVGGYAVPAACGGCGCR
jgi:hypothetical protein